MTSTLSASEWDILKEGFCIESNHIQSKNAERILKKFGYEKVSSRPPTKRRPGPKPKNSARLTEDEIRAAFQVEHHLRWADTLFERRTKNGKA